jgi:cardiolipin synthase A/B
MRRQDRTRLAVALTVTAAVLVWHSAAHRGAGAGPVAELPTALPASAVADRLIVEPDAGMGLIDALLASPRRSLDLTMYELVDPQAESILADDEARGVRVRVILDSRLEKSRNSPAYGFLRSRGVDVTWSSGRFFATHEKAFVIDGATAVVMSLNLTSRYYATSRDVAVVDHDPHDVSAIEAVFDADRRGAGVGTPAGDDLVWSPGQSAADFIAMINGAHRSIAVESEELSSEPVVAALVAAAHRGLQVSVAMTYDRDWTASLARIAGAGGRVSLMYGESPRYIHAKLLAIDVGTPQARAFVGSENISDSSLWHDRELGVVLVAPALVDRVADVIRTDLDAGRNWR